MLEFLNGLYIKAMLAKDNAIDALTDENGEANIIAIILVLAIVIALAIIFRTQLTALFNRIWSSLFDNVSGVLN